jgi:halimadienyl-diphosphate synthase
MDLHRSSQQLLTEIGPGHRISRSAYDTAWVARLIDLDEPLGMAALDWLRAHQLPDGSWGAESPRYFHDRLICTLAAMIALARCGQAEDHKRLQRAQLALEFVAGGLSADPAGETVGFEMLVPTLLAEADTMGVIPGLSGGLLGRLTQRLSNYRAAKLAALPGGRINRLVTVAFSAEMIGCDGLRLLDVENLQEENGSVACSPAATAFFALHVRPHDSRALTFLQKYAIDGALPYVVPIDVFELAWPLWNLALAGDLDGDLLALCQPHLDYLEKAWKPGEGVAALTELSLMDGDDTAVTYEALARFDRAVDLEGVLHFEKDGHFRCYGLEANPSISTNIHVLGALRQAGLGMEHRAVQKVLLFLQRVQTMQMFWFDKWHASPYYATAHAVIACAGLADDLVDDAVYWILATQGPDGAWGYYMPTAEETAYCLQALVTWKRQGHAVPNDVLKRGALWLTDHAEPPYPPLWIGKCLYYPELVVRSAVLSALTMAAQE